MASRILIVEDNDRARLALRNALEGEGMQVADVPNAMEAIARLKTEPFEVVITELALPEMNGFELMRYIGRDHPGARVIAVAAEGDGSEFNLAAAKHLGAVKTLRKPFPYAELLRTLEGVLGLDLSR